MEGSMKEGNHIDVSGDGNVSIWEEKISQDLQNIEGRDLYGDGHVSEEEIRMTRVIEGRKIWCKGFISRNLETIKVARLVNPTRLPRPKKFRILWLTTPPAFFLRCLFTGVPSSIRREDSQADLGYNAGRPR